MFSFFCGNLGNNTIQLRANEIEINSIDQELIESGMSEETFKLDLESNEDVSVLLFVEPMEEKENYFIYFYDPIGISHFNFQILQIGYCTNDKESELEKDSNLKVLDHTLKLLGYSSNNCVAKYSLTMDVEWNTYRRYSIRQTMYMSSRPFLRKWQILGDEYLYYNDALDNSVKYHYKKANYISLNNVHCSSFIAFNESFWQSLFTNARSGNEFYFYGFSVDNYSIDNLNEVEIIYNYQSLEAYWFLLEFGIGAFFNPDVEKASQYDLRYVPTFGEEKLEDTIILESDKVDETFDTYFWKPKKELKFNSISNYSDLIKNDNDSFSSYIQSNFNGCDYVVNFASFNAHKYDDKVDLDAESLQKAPELISYLKSTNLFEDEKEYYASVLAGFMHKYKTTYIYNVELVRLRFETEGKEYDLQVITAPVETEGVKGTLSSNVLSLFERIVNWFKRQSTTIKVIIVILCLIVFGPFVFFLIKLLVALVKLIIAPFKLLFKRKE